MRTRFKVFFFFLLVVGINARAQQGYLQQIQHFRDSVDKYFLSSNHSPLDSAEKVSFKGLLYFPADTAYRIPCKLKKKLWHPVFLMKTTTDRLPEYRTYGDITFELNGKKQQLRLYQNVALSKKEGFADYLFCPFKDLTNGFETYGGGRYLDFRMKDFSNGRGLIDFNYAYNPYCAYNHKYSCPVPPKANHLKEQINAGVKVLQ